MKRTLGLGTAAVFAVLWLSSPLWAQNTFIIPPSPQANGRAGIYTSSQTDDPLAAISNPALLGFQADRNRLMVGCYPGRTRWTYSDGFSGHTHYGYSARALQFGLNRATLQRYFAWNVPVSIGLGYQENYWNAGSGGYGYSGTQRSQATTLSAALHYRYLQAAVGLNYRFTRMKGDYMRGNPSSLDFGLFVQSPLERIIYHNELAAGGQTLQLRPFCTPSFSYVATNVGKAYAPYDYSYGHDTYLVALPRTAKIGLNLSAGIQAAHPAHTTWQLCSFDLGIQAQDNLVTYSASGRDYQNLTGNIHPSSVLFGKGETGVLLQKGYEAGVLEFVFLRWGNFSGDGDYIWSRINESEGFGIHLSGLMKALTWSPLLPQGRVTDFITHHLDVQYEQSRFRSNPSGYWMTDGTFKELTVLLKY